MKKSDLDLLNYLLSENVSDEEKNIVVSKNNKKLTKSSSHLEKEKLIDYIFNPNMPVSAKKIFSSYIGVNNLGKIIPNVIIIILTIIPDIKNNCFLSDIFFILIYTHSHILYLYLNLAFFFLVFL